MEAMSGKKNEGISITIEWIVWPCIAAMVIAMMAFGYSCHGCGDCRAPKTEQR